MFYTYILRHPETNQAFYVGKGQGNRPENHITEAKKKGYGIRANRYKVNKIRSILNAGLEVKIEKIAAPSEKHAFEIEELLILMYGRLDNGTGILTNLTNGGEGTAGIDHTGSKNPNYGNTGELSAWFGRKHTVETKLKIAKAQKGRVLSEEHKAKMRKPKSEEGRKAIALARQNSKYRPSVKTKQKISEVLKGRPSPMKGRTQSDEARLKMSLARKGIAKPKVVCPHCQKSTAVNTSKRWHFDNCKTTKEYYVGK